MAWNIDIINFWLVYNVGLSKKKRRESWSRRFFILAEVRSGEF
jgi:hypothetical protein